MSDPAYPPLSPLKTGVRCRCPRCGVGPLFQGYLTIRKECTNCGLDYGFAGQMKLDEVTGGSPYGTTTIAGGDGSRQPTQNELDAARYQGRRVAETAIKLHG